MTRAAVTLLQSAGFLHTEANKQPKGNLFHPVTGCMGPALYLMNKIIVPMPLKKDSGWWIGCWTEQEQTLWLIHIPAPRGMACV